MCPWRQPDRPTDIHIGAIITEESAEQQGLKELFHVPHVSLAILASTNHKDGPLSIHTAPSQIACWAVWTVVEFLLTLQFVQSAHCKHLFPFFLILSEEAERGREGGSSAGCWQGHNFPTYTLFTVFLQGCDTCLSQWSHKKQMGAFREIASAARINNSYTSLLRKKERGRRRLENQQSRLPKLEWFKAGADSDRLIDSKNPWTLWNWASLMFPSERGPCGRSIMMSWGCNRSSVWWLCSCGRNMPKLRSGQLVSAGSSQSLERLS